MLIASIIFVLSFAAMIQFAVLSWRAGLLSVAASRWPSNPTCWRT